MKRNVYVLTEGESVECYSNLSKLIKNTPKLSYYPIYRALSYSNRVEKEGYTITKTILR